MHTCRTDDDLTILFSVAKRYQRDALLKAWCCGPLGEAGPPTRCEPPRCATVHCEALHYAHATRHRWARVTP